MYRHFLKRVFDIFFSFIGLIVASIPMLIIAILIKLDSKGPVIFKQQRLGKNGRTFNILKFRSMCVGAEQQGSGVYSGKGDARVTKIGKILRATSLDEIPQLLSVLKGDMSFIGPRPPLTYHPWPLEKYTEEQKRMFEVRPGITGWAQINGRKDVEWNKRIKLNVWYVDNLSMWLDIKILFKTVFKVFSNADNENKGKTVVSLPETENTATQEVAATNDFVDKKNLKLMYITNNVEVAKIVEDAGVERIFIDMEYIGKSVRQGGMDTVQSHHTIEDIKNIRKVISKAEVMVRCNPIHDATKEYTSSKEEIDAIVESGADVIMLPYFKTASEVKEFISLVGGRTKTLPLVETPEAVACIDEILELDGLDEIFVGLNDLSLGYGMKFMFELLVNGTLEGLCDKFKKKGIPFGFGGIAALGKGMLCAEKVIAEHYRIGSTCAILSRSFCNTNLITDLGEIRKVFDVDLKAIRDWEKKCQSGLVDFAKNREEVETIVKEIVKGLN